MTLMWNNEPLILLTPSDVCQQIAARARALRLAAGWTQRTLAERSGMSLASLRQFESTGRIAFESLLKIATVLGRLGDLENVFQPPPTQSIDELAQLNDRPKRQRGRQ